MVNESRYDVKDENSFSLGIPFKNVSFCSLDQLGSDRVCREFLMSDASRNLTI